MSRQSGWALVLLLALMAAAVTAWGPSAVSVAGARGPGRRGTLQRLSSSSSSSSSSSRPVLDLKDVEIPDELDEGVVLVAHPEDYGHFTMKVGAMVHVMSSCCMGPGRALITLPSHLPLPVRLVCRVACRANCISIQSSMSR